MATSGFRLLLRPSSIRAGTKMVSVSTLESISFRPALKLRPPSRRILRSSAALSCCVQSFLPKHNATAMALMNSMLPVSMEGYGWLSEAVNDDV